MERLKTEHEEQREFVSWFRKTFNKTRILAIPNGGARTLATASRLKAEGVSPGVPDLFIPAWGLWVEMKRKKHGAITEEQRDWIYYLTDNQYHCIVAKGCDDAIQQINEFIVEQLDLELKPIYN